MLFNEELFYGDDLYGKNPNPELELKERALTEQIFWEQIRESEKYNFFATETKRMKINPEDVFNKRHDKQKLLEEIMEYESLGDIPMDKCVDVQVGKAFKVVYNKAEKIIVNYLYFLFL